jgi:hypothetical protein
MPRFMSSRSARPIISSKLAEAQLRHQLAHFLGDEEEVVDDVLGLAGEARLRSTGSCVATPTGQVLRWHLRIMMQPSRSAARWRSRTRRRRAARRSPRRGRCFIRRRPARDAAAQAVEHQRLLRLGQADLPGRAGMLDRGQRRGAGAAVVAGDRDVVGRALATPAATVPTPTSDTSFTEIEAAG